MPINALPDEQLHPQLRLPQYQTMQLGAGKKQKIRPGDIVGALTQECAVAAADIGDINIKANSAFVAVKRQSAAKIVGRVEPKSKDGL